MVTVKSCEKAGNEMTGGEESLFFIFLDALSAFSVQVKVLFVLFNLCMGCIRNVLDRICLSKRVSRNCLIHTKWPMRLVAHSLMLGVSFLLYPLYNGLALLHKYTSTECQRTRPSTVL